MYRDDLEFELGQSLLEWIRDRPPGIRDWNAYLYTALWRRALDLVKQWRRRDVLNVEFTSARDPPSSSSIEPDQTDTSPRSTSERLQALQRRLSNADRHFIRQLKDCEGSVSRLAQRLGVHRNTIHRRIRRISSGRCPIEIESVPPNPGALWARERAELEAVIQQPFLSDRQVLRARVILAVLDGGSYDEITKHRGASASTIARWRHRFAKRGVAGLIAVYRGRKPSRAAKRLRRWLRTADAGKRPSVRVLASRFGLGKSTVQRILKVNP